MELSQYIQMFKRWVWLIVLTAVLFGSAGFITTNSRPDQYRAQTIIAVGGYFQQPNPESSDIRVGIDLVYTYAQVVRYFDVLNGAVENLQLPFSTDRLRSLIETRIISSTSMLEIGVTYTDPVLAAAIANELAEQLILQGPSGLTPDQQQQIILLDEQIAAQRMELDDLRTQLEDIDARLSDNGLAEGIREALVQQRNTAINQINEINANIALFSSTKANLQQRTNSIEVVETARIPVSPLGSNLILTVILAAGLGAALAFGLVLLLEYLNDTYRSADEVGKTMAQPVIGVITNFGERNQPGATRLLTHMPGFSKTAEEYRGLRTNLAFKSHYKRPLIITSSVPQEGKSTTSANLAISMALSGLRVLLIDADLRHPSLHTLFNLDNQVGLTTLLTRSLELENGDELPDGMRNGRLTDQTWDAVVNKPNIPNLFVITSGKMPSNPAELLGSNLMKLWNEQFVAYPKLDVIIYDTPPTLAVSDSIVLAGAIQGQVLLVVKARETRRSDSQRAKERFESIDTPIAGMVFNFASPKDETYYGTSYRYNYQS